MFKDIFRDIGKKMAEFDTPVPVVLPGPKVSRETFLKSVALVAGGAVLTACGKPMMTYEEMHGTAVARYPNFVTSTPNPTVTVTTPEFLQEQTQNNDKNLITLAKWGIFGGIGGIASVYTLCRIIRWWNTSYLTEIELSDGYVDKRKGHIIAQRKVQDYRKWLISKINSKNKNE